MFTSAALLIQREISVSNSSLCVYFFSTLSLSSVADPRTPLSCLSELNSHLTFFSKHIFSVFPYFKMNFSARRSSVAAPPTPGGYPYPPAPDYGGYRSRRCSHRRELACLRKQEIKGTRYFSCCFMSWAPNLVFNSSLLGPHLNLVEIQHVDPTWDVYNYNLIYCCSIDPTCKWLNLKWYVSKVY